MQELSEKLNHLLKTNSISQNELAEKWEFLDK